MASPGASLRSGWHCVQKNCGSPPTTSFDVGILVRLRVLLLEYVE